jgi:uncharacterized membrane protein
MDINNAASILLIIVSTVLAIFLVVAIIATIYFIKLLKELRRVTAHAEVVAESVESAANSIGKAASPLAVLKLISSIVTQASKINRKKG